MPIITLTSDFGILDHTAALVKGQLYEHLNKNPTIIDITHNVVNFDLRQAAYFIDCTIPNFPKGTYHMMLVNLYEEQVKRLLCVELNGSYVLCADNGFVNLLSLDGAKEIRSVQLDDSMPHNLANYIQTMAGCINWLEEGNEYESLGDVCTDYKINNNLQPMVSDNLLEGYVIYIDQYENVVTNIKSELFYKIKGNRKFKISFKRYDTIEEISENYGDVKPGNKLAIFNAGGYLEIAINQGNAAGLFGFITYSNSNKVQDLNMHRSMYYQKVSIWFE